MGASSSPDIESAATMSLRTFLSLAAVLILLLLPSGFCFAYGSSLHGPHPFLELGTVLLFLGSCATCGAYCHARAIQSGDGPHSHERRGINLTYLVSFGVVLGFLSVVCGVVNCNHPSRLGTLPAILSAWIVTLAVVTPIDSAFYWQHRRTTIAWAALVPFGFCLGFPAYVFARTRSGRLTAVATTSIVLTVIGWTLWLLGAEMVGYFD